jgi:YegS/Rv2252/BmrU family lipid kinase
MKYHFIYNPVAGHGSSKKAWLLIKNYLQNNNVDFELHETQYINHAKIITQELTKSGEAVCIVSVGGDGTLNEIINGIMNFDTTTIGIIPCGSGNDFVVATKIPRGDVIAALKFLLNNESRKVNYMQVNNERAINVAGFGIDTDVLEDYYKRKRFSAKFRYKISTIKCALFLKKHTSEISVDDGPFVKESTAMLTIGNGKTIGGGICVCPNAVIDDDILDFTFIRCFANYKTL